MVPLCGFLTHCWHSCTPGSMQGELGGMQRWGAGAEQSRAGCLPKGILHAMPRHAMPCRAVLRWPRRPSVTNCRTGAWAAVSCARHTRVPNPQPGLRPTPAPPPQPLQPSSPAFNPHPRQRIPVPGVIPHNLALQRTLGPTEAGCSPARHPLPLPVRARFSRPVLARAPRCSLGGHWPGRMLSLYHSFVALL